LPDLLQSFLPFWKFSELCDYLLLAALILTIIRFVIFSPERFVIFRRFCFLEGCLMFARGICIVITQLSQPQQDCVSDISEPLFIEAFYLLSFLHKTCSDCMFSLHTASLTSMALIWTTFSHNSEWSLCFSEESTNRVRLLKQRVIEPHHTCSFSLTIILVWCYCIFTYFIIIITHFHYSVDVFVGFIISFCFTRLYTHFVYVIELRDDWIGKIFRWYEHDTSHILPLDEAVPQPDRPNHSLRSSLLPAANSSSISNIDPTSQDVSENMQHGSVYANVIDEADEASYEPPLYKTIASQYQHSIMVARNDALHHTPPQSLSPLRPLVIPDNPGQNISYVTPSNQASSAAVPTASALRYDTPRRSPSLSQQHVDLDGRYDYSEVRPSEVGPGLDIERHSPVSNSAVQPGLSD
jgi:hypothetical protein